jgi:predicted N-acetyltransferase YhbS
MGMDVKVRPGTPDDAEACGRICYAAFAAVAAAHGAPCDFPGPEVATALTSRLLAHPEIFGVVAEADGTVVGSNFIDARSSIAGVGPITVDPAVQDAAVGRMLMVAVMEHVEGRVAGVRLVQTAYHTRSLSLYAKLGFQVREPLACMQGSPIGHRVAGSAVRPATAADQEACNRLCREVHGHDRAPEVSDALGHRRASVVERDGRITGYSTGLSFFNHTVGQTVDDVEALIDSATEFAGPGILVPMRNAALFRSCLGNGLRVVQVMTLMTTGLYNEPAGAYLPSVMF